MGENQELELIEEEAMEEEAIDKEALRITDPLLFDDKYITECISTKEFQEGQKIGDKIGGIYTQLMNYGLDEDTVVTLVLNHMTAENNIEVQKLNLEIAKANAINVEKNSL